MSANKAQNILVYIVTVLNQNGGEKPSGHIYAELMEVLTLEEYNKILSIGESMELWTTAKSYLVSLSPKGLKLANLVSELVAPEARP